MTLLKRLKASIREVPRETILYAFGPGAVVREWDDMILRTVVEGRGDAVACIWFDKESYFHRNLYSRTSLRLVTDPDPDAVAHLPAANVRLRSGGPVLKVLRFNPWVTDGDVLVLWEHPTGVSRELSLPVQALVALDS